MLLCDQYVMPETLKEALTIWAGAPEGSRLIAGGTDLQVGIRQGIYDPDVLVDIADLQELRGIDIAEDAVTRRKTAPRKPSRFSRTPGLCGFYFRRLGLTPSTL